MPAGARFTGFCIGMLHLRILRDCFLLLFPAAVNLNVLPGNIACVVTRKKAYQVCIFHIAACSSYKGKLARLGVVYIIIFRGTYAAGRDTVNKYPLSDTSLASALVKEISAVLPLKFIIYRSL